MDQASAGVDNASAKKTSKQQMMLLQRDALAAACVRARDDGEVSIGKCISSRRRSPLRRRCMQRGSRYVCGHECACDLQHNEEEKPARTGDAEINTQCANRFGGSF